MVEPQRVVSGTPAHEVACDRISAALLRRAVEHRDEAAWRSLVANQLPAVLHHASRACGEPSLVDRVAHETFTRAFRCGRRYRDGVPLAHWTARVCAGAAADLLARHPSMAERSFDGDAGANDAATKRRVRGAVLRLPSHLRDVVWLTTFAEISLTDAARALGTPVETAASRAHAAAARLRAVIPSTEPDALRALFDMEAGGMARPIIPMPASPRLLERVRPRPYLVGLVATAATTAALTMSVQPQQPSAWTDDLVQLTSTIRTTAQHPDLTALRGALTRAAGVVAAIDASPADPALVTDLRTLRAAVASLPSGLSAQPLLSAIDHAVHHEAQAPPGAPGAEDAVAR